MIDFAFRGLFWLIVWIGIALGIWLSYQLFRIVMSWIIEEELKGYRIKKKRDDGND
jgi:hypothetical protein